ncbi:MAG: acylphosphatase [Steroidobacteraceae bacterium]
MLARRLLLTGHVQGVGFRPFVYRLATQLGLAGSVHNARGRVEVRVQGSAAALERFASEIVRSAPPLARPSLERTEDVEPDAAIVDFRIAASDAQGEAQVFVPPDYFACEQCLAELADPVDRRHRYPFINCTQCGPRYTLIRSLPYDRPNTSMAGFALCPQCRREYEDPLDRRYHAEPVACPACGPEVAFAVPADAAAHRRGEAALGAAGVLLRAGRILAVRGIGGYHLLCDARAETAVAELRRAQGPAAQAAGRDVPAPRRRWSRSGARGRRPGRDARGRCVIPRGASCSCRCARMRRWPRRSPRA